MPNAIELSALELDPAGPLRRNAPRPLHLRDSSYDEKFDSLTVFYDCFRTFDGRGTIMLGPPLLNLEHLILRTVYQAQGLSWLTRGRRFSGLLSSGSMSQTLMDLERFVLRAMNKASRLSPLLRPLRVSPFSLSGYALCSQLRTGPFSSAPLPPGLFLQRRLTIQPNCSEMFRGRRVVLTLSRDNELQWVRDWTRFFVEKHGADAVLLYDNGSTKYSLDELRNTIASVSGISVACVVGWPYKYGPIAIGHNHWDSNYCQPCAVEHARHRFLADAQAVVNCDIDELPITAGAEPIFDLAARSVTGYLKYDGQWVENCSLSPEAKTAQRRHKHFFYRSREAPCDTITDPYKWTLVPSRCPPGTQWWVHGILQMPADPLSSQVRFRHFKAINTNWSHHRWQPETPNERNHEIDQELREWLKVFDAE